MLETCDHCGCRFAVGLKSCPECGTSLATSVNDPTPERTDGSRVVSNANDISSADDDVDEE